MRHWFDLAFEFVVAGVILGCFYMILHSITGCATYQGIGDYHETPLAFKTRQALECEKIRDAAEKSGMYIQSFSCD